MTVNKKIQASDYNYIQSRLAAIMGPGNINPSTGVADPSFGYGQNLSSTAVSAGTASVAANKIRVSDWTKLVNDINNIYKHQNGSTVSLTTAVEHQRVKSDEDSTSFVGSISGTTLTSTSVSLGMLAIGQTVAGGGITGGTVITGEASPISITITSFSAKSLNPDGYTYTVEFTIPPQPEALPVGQDFVISGNSNTNYNGTFTVLTSSLTTVTVTYHDDPGSYGTGTTTITALANNPWGLGRWIVNNSQTVSSTALSASSTTEYPYAQYTKLFNGSRVDDLIINRFNLFTASQSISSNKGSKSTTWTPPSYWNSGISSITTVTFTSANAARYFFNSGGRIKFTSTHVGATALDQNYAWQNLLSGATGTIEYYGSGVYSLTNSFVEYQRKTASYPYGSNFWRVSARVPDIVTNVSGTALKFEFKVEWIDNYTDPGFPPPGDQVDGTTSIAVQTVESYGTLDPVGLGVFSVESPTVSIGTIG